MNDDKEQQNMCSRKKNYASETLANHKRNELRRTVGGPHYVYKCPYCGMWHITTHFATYRRYERMFKDSVGGKTP